MGTIKLTKKEMETRGGILDELMEQVFDVSILVDRQRRIVHISRKAFYGEPNPLLPQPDASVIGQDISVLDDISPFSEVLETGRAATGLFLEIHGRNCLSSIYPVKDGDETIGALGTIVFRDMKKVKQIFAGGDSGDSADASQIYDNLSRIESGYAFSDFIGCDPSVADLIDKAGKAAKSRLPVLIIGETGTGKEIIAGAIHNSRHRAATSRRQAPYVTINCTAIPENLLESELFGYEKGAFTGAESAKAGKFELAAGGDLLLDEIGDMNLAMQSKLLRVLESREFERVGGSTLIPLQAGIIASTNKNLYLLSEEKKFRADLYFRLNTIELYIPPLRNRPGDIPLLIDAFCQSLSISLRLSSSALGLLTAYSWPGNVRQLKNLIQRLSIFYENTQITESDIERELRVGQRNYNEAAGLLTEGAGSSSAASLSAMEKSQRAAVITAMKNHRNNVSAAARELGVSRGTLYSKLRKYGML